MQIYIYIYIPNPCPCLSSSSIFLIRMFWLPNTWCRPGDIWWRLGVQAGQSYWMHAQTGIVSPTYLPLFHIHQKLLPEVPHKTIISVTNKKHLLPCMHVYTNTCAYCSRLWNNRSGVRILNFSEGHRHWPPHVTQAFFGIFAVTRIKKVLWQYKWIWDKNMELLEYYCTGNPSDEV